MRASKRDREQERQRETKRQSDSDRQTDRQKESWLVGALSPVNTKDYIRVTGRQTKIKTTLRPVFSSHQPRRIRMPSRPKSRLWDLVNENSLAAEPRWEKKTDRDYIFCRRGRSLTLQ